MVSRIEWATFTAFMHTFDYEYAGGIRASSSKAGIKRVYVVILPRPNSNVSH
jgi:hypothetical protein